MYLWMISHFWQPSADAIFLLGICRLANRAKVCRHYDDTKGLQMPGRQTWTFGDRQERPLHRSMDTGRVLKKQGERKLCIFSWKLGRNIKRERKSYYLGTFALYSLTATFLKIISLAGFARLHFMPQLETEANTVIFSCIFGVIIRDSQLPKCTKHASN